MAAVAAILHDFHCAAVHSKLYIAVDSASLPTAKSFTLN